METLTIFLLKETIQNAVDALDPDKESTPFLLADEFPLTGTLFVGAQNRSTPSWVAMINPHLAAPVRAVYSASISAVLIVSYEGRHFALTLGHGKSLLRPTTWVRDFGLKATLNRVDPSKLRSIDSKIYDDLVVTTRKQTSRSSKVSSFELDVGRALVRGVTGDVDGNPSFMRLTGADALRLTTELPFAELSDLLEELMAAYNDDAYREAFGWIDNIREADPTRNAALDEQLVQSLLAADATDAYLAPADIVDWEEIHGFNFTGGVRTITYPDLNLRDYLQILEYKGTAITPELLKRHNVRVRYEGNDDLQDRWSIYDCLVWETALDNKNYVLFDSRWFEIEPAYAIRVVEFVNSLRSDAIAFPDAAAGQEEGDYNAGVANAFPDIYALLDCENFLPTGAASRIEFCDLLSLTRQIIHIKKRSSSATLSHLFSQGSVASDVFLQDQGLRISVNERLIALQKPGHAAIIPANPPTATDYEIVYAIIAREGQNGWPPPLPFFSAVNLMHHAKRVRNLSFRVSLQYIRQT